MCSGMLDQPDSNSTEEAKMLDEKCKGRTYSIQNKEIQNSRPITSHGKGRTMSPKNNFKEST